MSLELLKVSGTAAVTAATTANIAAAVFAGTPHSAQLTVDRDQLWPPLPDDCWGHCGSSLGLFGSLKRFNGPLTAR
jgi:hypothetical protein